MGRGGMVELTCRIRTVLAVFAYSFLVCDLCIVISNDGSRCPAICIHALGRAQFLSSMYALYI